MGFAGDFVFATARYESGDWESAPLMPAYVIDTWVKYTTLSVAPTGVYVPLSSQTVFDYPFLWLTGHRPVRLNAEERRNLKRYVERGGFIVFDDHDHNVDGIFHKTATEEIKRLFGPLKEIPNNHELYTCFFTFANGPPATSHELNGWGDQLVHEHLYGIMRPGTDRIALLYSSKDYSSDWNQGVGRKQFDTVDPSRFGVNMIVYALTR